MNKAFGFAAASALVSAGGASANGNVLYDNPPDTIVYNEIVNQEFGDFPNYSTYIVDDVSFPTQATIMSVTIYLPAGTGNWSGVTTARLHIFEKNGSLPGAANDPSTIPVVNVTFSMATSELTASGLNEVLAAGDYWIGLTAQAEFGSKGHRFMDGGANVVGDVAAYRNPGGGFGLPAGTGWGPATDITSAFRDAAMTITGKIVPAPGALALLGLAGVAAGRRRRA